MIDNLSQLKKKKKKRKKATESWNLTLCHHMPLYCDVAIGIYEVIDTHCLSNCYVGGNSCKCKSCIW
jgi:hypothetical protein